MNAVLVPLCVCVSYLVALQLLKEGLKPRMKLFDVEVDVVVA